MACINPPSQDHITTPKYPRGPTFTLGSVAIEGPAGGRSATEIQFAAAKQGGHRASSEIGKATTSSAVYRALGKGKEALESALANADLPQKQSLHARIGNLERTAAARIAALKDSSRRSTHTAVVGNKSKNANTPQSGVVIFTAKSTFTIAEIEQFSRYVNTANAARHAGRLSSTGKVSTTGSLRAEASRAANHERRRAERVGQPYGGQVGHAPDTTWTGRPGSDEWHDQTATVNQSLGGQSRAYPQGFTPTDFALGYTWESE